MLDDQTAPARSLSSRLRALLLRRASRPDDSRAHAREALHPVVTRTVSSRLRGTQDREGRVGNVPFPGLPALRRGDRERFWRLLSGDLSGLDLVCVMVDGVHFAEQLLVVAMGIAIDGNKHPLALVEGSTETRPSSPSFSSRCVSGASTSPARRCSSSTARRRSRRQGGLRPPGDRAANCTRSEMSRTSAEGARPHRRPKSAPPTRGADALRRGRAHRSPASCRGTTPALREAREGLRETLVIYRSASRRPLPAPFARRTPSSR